MRIDLKTRTERDQAIAAAGIAGLKLAHLSMGWQISGGLAPATASRIARMIMDVRAEESRGASQRAADAA